MSGTVSVYDLPTEIIQGLICTSLRYEVSCPTLYRQFKTRYCNAGATGLKSGQKIMYEIIRETGEKYGNKTN
jgi:hypothetical protein